jgi:type IV pilus assembly protein PilY1
MKMKRNIRPVLVAVVAILIAFGVTNVLAAMPPVDIATSPLINSCGNEDGSEISGAVLSGPTFTSGNSFVYQAGFNSIAWSGSLKKLALTKHADGNVGIASKPEWDAAQSLTGQTADERKIYTSNVSDAKATVEFVWHGLSNTQKAFLNTSPDDGKNDGLGEKRVDYLRGVRTLEKSQPNGMFRTRVSVLGDVVNSNPVFVGAPAANVQGTGYQDFYAANKNRVPAVYVGANDGMLHAFNANDGRELFAYIPNALIPSLNKLTSPDYKHRSYVDGPLGVGEAMVGGHWKSVLVSGMGGGAQGVFALDVTNPAAFGGALWEFTDADDADMGNVIGMPLIARFQSGGKFAYFAVVSSGLNNYKDDGRNAFNADAASALFLLSLDKSPSEKWARGINYFKFRLPASNPDLKNGLGAPALATDVSGTVRYIYAGDLQGNLWRIDVSSAGTLSKVRTSTQPLFVAEDVQGNRQPITMQPKIVFAPSGGYVVLFGTGKFIEPADMVADNFRTQSFYAVYDHKENIVSSFDRTSLVGRPLEKSGDGFKISGAAFQYGNATSPGMGWYIDFPDSAHTGERAVANPVLANGTLFFNTLIPSSDDCISERSYALDVLTGLSKNDVTGNLSRIAVYQSPVVIQTDAVVGTRNAIGQRTVQKQVSVVNIGTNDVTNDVAPADRGVFHSTVTAGRISWREIFNWQELRNALTRK